MNGCGVWWGLRKGWEEKQMEISCWKLRSVSTIMNINIAYTPRMYTYKNTQIDISMVFISLSTLQMTTELNPTIYLLKDNYCAYHVDWKMERLDDLAQIQGLWQNRIHKLWFHVTILCPCIYRKSPFEFSNRRDLWNFTDVCRCNHRNCRTPYFLALFSLLLR